MKVYVLLPEDGLFGIKWAYAKPVEPVYLGAPPICEVCGDPVGLKPWLPPHRLRLSTRNPQKWGDFVWAGTELLVSDMLVELSQRGVLAGLDIVWPAAELVRTVSAVDRDANLKLPRYNVVRIDWNGANLDDQASGIAVKFPEKVICSYCRTGGILMRRTGIILEASSWTGKDIFRARGAGEILVTEKFKQIAEEQGFRNLRLLPAEHYAYEHPGRWYVRDVV